MRLMWLHSEKHKHARFSLSLSLSLPLPSSRQYVPGAVSAAPQLFDGRPCGMLGEPAALHMRPLCAANRYAHLTNPPTCSCSCPCHYSRLELLLTQQQNSTLCRRLAPMTGGLRATWALRLLEREGEGERERE
jgi:hypothetical protein